VYYIKPYYEHIIERLIVYVELYRKWWNN